jgi:hypothetical protein
VTGPIGGLGPGDAVGVAYAEVRFRGDKAPKDVARILDDAGDEGNDEMADIGDKWGDTLDKRLKSSTKNTGRDVARGISSGIEREGIKVTRETLQFDRDGSIVRRWVTTEAEKATRAVNEAAASGVFSKVGEAFTSAIGAGFNVSGRSPLIALLIPVIGIIVELVGAAIQAAGSLVAVLALVPNLIFSIGVQAGVLILAFHGVGEAISGAFAAKNADELNEAIKNLTPSAQEFVRSLLPIKDFISSLSKIAQEGFFSSFGNVLSRITEALGPSLPGQISAIASSLGTLFSQVLSFFGSAVFVRFLGNIIPSIMHWLDIMGPSLFSFLFGLTTFGNALIPFLNWFGETFAALLADIGGWLNDLSHDQSFLDWLDRMKETFNLLGHVIADAGIFIASFAGALDRAGGNDLIKAFSEQLLTLAGFFASDEGVKALEGLIHAAIILSQILVGLIVTLTMFFFLLETTAEFLKFLFGEIGDFFEWVGGGILDFVHWLGEVLGKFFTEDIPALWDFVKEKFGEFIEFLKAAFASGFETILGTILEIGGRLLSFLVFDLVGGIVFHIGQAIASVVEWVKGLGGRIADAAGDMLGVLYNAGRNVIAGLINGIRSMFGPLANVADQVFQILRDRAPFSPAKEGPLSGSGDPKLAGENIVTRLAEGMEIAAPELATASNNVMSNVTMGPGAVQMNFYGQPPSNAQAGGIGAAAGNSLADALAQRNTRLAIRSIGMAA